jgi:solute carrier family 34 (sodium-dependent phosphate cotransporter)
LLTLDKIFPYILGANTRTTFRALMALVVTGFPAAVTVAIYHFLFNSIGASLIYPLRKIPISMSKSIANFSLKSRMYPIAYIGLFFFVIPLIVIIIIFN